jgi:uncharacterized repeat protein (TIGR03803 family)
MEFQTPARSQAARRFCMHETHCEQGLSLASGPPAPRGPTQVAQKLLTTGAGRQHSRPVIILIDSLGRKSLSNRGRIAPENGSVIDYRFAGTDHGRGLPVPAWPRHFRERGDESHLARRISEMQPSRSILAILLAGVTLSSTTASAQSLYTIIASLDGNGSARRPMGGVIKAPNGALFGTTWDSGTLPQCGAVYKVDAAGTRSVVHAFNRTDGCNPVGELVVGADGHLYGTTYRGGPNVDAGIASSGTGTVFRISMPGEVFSMIHAFAPFDTVMGGYPEGLGPYAGLTLGNDNSLYGTTASGGTGKCGTVFRITPAGVLTTLHSLLLLQDGCAANATLSLSSDGNFYGTATAAGGSGASGSIFRITPAGAFTKLFAFSVDTSCSCYSKGAVPIAEPLDDGTGYLYGTASSGGPAGTGSGTIWKLSKTSGELTVLKAFTGSGSGVDGSVPTAGLTLGSDGNFYGTTSAGGTNSQGTLFRISPGGAHEVLHHFAIASGAVPDGRLIEPEPGEFIGTTQTGGTAGGGGVVFRRRPVTAVMALDKTSLVFGAVTSGTTLVYKTSPQIARLTQSGSGTVTWTATANQPWLQVSPASGTGSATFSIAVAFNPSLPSSGSVSGAVTLSFNGAVNSPGPITVKLNLLSGASDRPFGVIDTPIDFRTGVTGAVPFTGWALDDLELSRVMICRAAVGAEVAPVDPNCAGAAQIFVGFPVFIDLARPDVAATFPEIPLNTRAGWGLMVLTNMLPNQGNGTFVFYAWAQDREGNSQLLGTRTITCDNLHGTLPFGSIDTPEQGGIASGASYVNFGWALTPQPKSIPIDGSTMTVLVDGVSVGTATYNNFRSDIATLFPGYANSAGAIGFRVLDTTPLANGSHTISWIVTDTAGATEGLGSRFFAVSNGVSAVTTAAESRAAAALSAVEIEVLPLAAAPLVGRRGWNLDAPYSVYQPTGDGSVVVRGEEIDRLEVHLGARAGTSHTGHLRVAAQLAPLPVGSTLDQNSGLFTWAPGVGFVGTYDLVFVRWEGARAVERREIRIVLQPKGRGAVGPQVVIDTPRSQQDLAQPLTVAGWAADLDAATGAGIATVHAWAYPLAGGPPVFLGAAEYGTRRPDVAAVHGQQFEHTGFRLNVNGLPHGHYDLTLFPWSTVTDGFEPPTIVRVTLR